MSDHLPECRVVYPREVLEPGEELPEGVSEDIGIRACADGCPRAEELVEHALQMAREHGWLEGSTWTWSKQRRSS